MRVVANSVSGIYLADLMEDSRDTCEGFFAAVAHVTWADKLIDFWIRSNIPLKFFCLFNADALPSPEMKTASDTPATK
jgi:hypothetical protein